MRKYSQPDERYRLERSSFLALNEYVPDSRVLVGGRVAISRGLRKHWTDNNFEKALGLQYLAIECQNGHVYLRQTRNENCPRCGSRPATTQHLLFPRFGYSTAGWEPLELRNDRFEQIGESNVCPIAFTEGREGEVWEDFGDIPRLRITYREEADLLIRNAGRDGHGFAVCWRCGFAMSESAIGEGKTNLPRRSQIKFEQHGNLYSSNGNDFCWKRNEKAAPVLRNRVLAAREITDMLLIETPIPMVGNGNSYYSLGRALVLAGARILELDERELGMEVIPLDVPGRGIVIYDTSPGGAGHCLELLRLGREWFDTAREILYVDDAHHSRCRRACLDCILDFSGQYRANELDRTAALQLMDNMLSLD